MSASPSHSTSEVQSESQFSAEVDAVLLTVEEAIEQSGADLEFETVAGILTIGCEDGSKIIINRQMPNREIWVAARSGGFHFRKADGIWADTRGGLDLAARIAKCINEQSGERVTVQLPVV